MNRRFIVGINMFAKFMFSIALLLANLSGVAQSKHRVSKKAPFNLIANGNFEDINVCTEFEAQCEPEGWFFIPGYSMLPQGNDSNRFEVVAVGSVVFGPFAGSYIYTKLLCQLKQGKQYNFSIWAVSPQNEFDHIDVWFGERDPLNYNHIRDMGDAAFSLTAQQADSARRKWRRYSYVYTAKGNEKFITLGNFQNTPLDRGRYDAVNKEGEVLYSIDDIRLTPADENETPCFEYKATALQVYKQNRRHPPVPLDEMADTSANAMNAAVKPKRKWVNPLATSRERRGMLAVTIPFDVDRTDPPQSFIDTLNAFVKRMEGKSMRRLVIVGHTDNSWVPEYNQVLSIRRAETVRQILRTHPAFATFPILIIGAADTQPIASNATPEGRQKNRRVEIIVEQ